MKKCAVLIVPAMITFFAMLSGLCEGGDSTIKVGLIAELTGDIPAVGAVER